jgi:pimeloyl-ACP methyl ester carboxylesterase
VKDKAAWRAPELGSAKEVQVAQGRIRYFDGGDGPPIVFVHGLFVNANVWRKIFARLTPRFRCVVLDLPFGSHELPANPDADLSERGVVNLIADAIDEIGLQDVTLVGMDTGGAICQFLVTQRPQEIARLVLCSCDYRDNFPPRIFSYLKALRFIQPLVPVLFAPFRLRAVRRLPVALGWLTKADLPREVEDSYSLPALDDRAVRRDVAKVTSVFDKKRLNQTADLLAEFDRPALIAWSADDKVFPAAHAQALAQDLPRARLEWIADSRTLSMEEQPARLAALIDSFITATADARPHPRAHVGPH